VGGPDPISNLLGVRTEHEARGERICSVCLTVIELGHWTRIYTMDFASYPSDLDWIILLIGYPGSPAYRWQIGDFLASIIV
jgi:hypothetical protein